MASPRRARDRLLRLALDLLNAVYRKLRGTLRCIDEMGRADTRHASVDSPRRARL